MQGLKVNAKETPSFDRKDPVEGLISPHLVGQTVNGCFTNGRFLIIETTNGQRLKIEWLKDSPVLHSVDCSVQIQGVSMFGEQGL